MKQRITIGLLFFLSVSISWAQESTEEKEGGRFILFGDFQIGVPLGDFKENLDDVGIGGGGGFLFRISETPVLAGFELAGMVYDSETRDYTVNIGGFFRDYEVKTNASIFLGHALLRIMPLKEGRFLPYIDGLIGFKNLFTRSQLIDDDAPEDEILESEIEKGDWAFSYGGALGLQVRLSKSGSVWLDLRCSYLAGSKAEYLVRKPDSEGPYTEPIDAFEQKSSVTDLLTPQVGLIFDLSLLSDEEEVDD